MNDSDEEVRKFGVVIFDDIHDPTSGWSCVAHGEPFRISSTSELATDTVWWTNIPYKHFYQDSEIWRQPNLRHDKYIVSAPNDVMREFGYDPKEEGPDYTSMLSAKIFENIMRLASKLAIDASPKLKADSIFKGKTLREDLRILLPEFEYPAGEAAEAMRSGRAWEEFTSLNTPVKGRGQGGKRIMLRFPRLSYAMKLLQTPLPKGPYEFLSRQDLRKIANGNRTKWVEQTTRPVMSEISVANFQAEIAPIYGFSNAIDKDNRVQRDWVAHPEFVILSRVSDIDVRNAWVGTEYWAMIPEIPKLVVDFLTHRSNSYSFSAGIVAETIWRSACLGEEKGKMSGPRGGDTHAATSWQGMWIRAHDKATMFQTSMRLTELGYTVISYGYGWVQVQVSEEALPQVIKDGMTLGLLPRLADVPDGVFTEKSSSNWTNEDADSKNLAHAIVTKQKSLLWYMDKYPLEPPARRRSYIEMVMKQIGREQQRARSSG